MKHQCVNILILGTVILLNVLQGHSQTFSKRYDHFDRQLTVEAYSIEATSYGYMIISSAYSEDIEAALE